MTSSRTGLAKQASEILGCGSGGQLRLASFRPQRIADGQVERGIDGGRSVGGSGIGRGCDERVSQILAMENDAAAGPTPNDIASLRLRGDVGEFSEVTEGKRRPPPAVEAQDRAVVACSSSASSIAMFMAAPAGWRSSCTISRSNSIGHELLERGARILRRGDWAADDQKIGAGLERLGRCQRAPLIIRR